MCGNLRLHDKCNWSINRYSFPCVIFYSIISSVVARANGKNSDQLYSHYKRFLAKVTKKD